MNSKELKNLMESYISIYESHFKVGDKVTCKDSGMEGKVIKLDDKEVGKYYTVKREDGKEVKYASDELKEKNGGASKDKEMKFHSKLDKLVHKTFGKSPEEQKEEVEQLDEISQKTAISAYAQRRTGEFEGDDSSDRVAKTNKLKGRIEKKFGAKAGEHAEKAAEVKTFGRKDASGRRKQSPQPRIQTSDHENQREFKRELRIRRDRRLRAARGEDTNEQVDIFDVVLEFLQAEGYAETLEEAEWLMSNVIDEEAINIILGEEKKLYPAEKVARKQEAVKRKEDIALHQRRDDDANKLYKRGVALSLKKKMSDIGYKKEEYVDESSVANRDPDKYEAGEKKKYAPVRGERTPMPPRGDKRREDFEKWYAKQMGR